jgi:hypothetical protein
MNHSVSWARRSDLDLHTFVNGVELYFKKKVVTWQKKIYITATERFQMGSRRSGFDGALLGVITDIIIYK